MQPTPGLVGSVLLSVSALSSVADGAQEFGLEWVEFHPANERLVSQPEVGLSDTQDKKYAWGDLDRDGLIDLVVARKPPQLTEGELRNVLFLNDGGVLVDRTAEFAIASTVPMDMGFLTPTHDTDVALVDIDQDGWLDVVTATSLGNGQRKHITHPRIYRNLGADGNGDWLGLRYEDDRFPLLRLSNGDPSWPCFAAVAADDVTGDGYPDLYFTDHDLCGVDGGDMNDRLLVNDGTGMFVDESALRMTAVMLASNIGTSAWIEDMNGDGARDVVRCDGAQGAGNPPYVSVSYNDPDQIGTFDVFDAIFNGAPYFVGVGDLNNDGAPDLAVGADGDDRSQYNTGLDSLGRVIWGPVYEFQFLDGGDDGFAGNIRIADLDGDTWNDIIITDVDLQVEGCNRRGHVYHNPGQTPGTQFRLREEIEQAGPDGWKGAVGLKAVDLRGSMDVAPFDLDGDGDLDLVIGRCSGTDVWLNATLVGTPYCSGDGSGTACPCANSGDPGEGCANSTGAGAVLAGGGSTSSNADDLVLSASQLTPLEPALLFVGDQSVNGGAGLALADGLRCVGGGVTRLGVMNATGGGVAHWGPGLGGAGGWGAGDTRYFQAWYRDPAGGPCKQGSNLSQAISVLFGP